MFEATLDTHDELNAALFIAHTMCNRDEVGRPMTTEPRTVPSWVNFAVKTVLRSLLHWTVSHNIMLLSIAGRRSRTAYSFPVRYVRDGELLSSFTDSGWWRTEHPPIWSRHRVRE